MRTSKLYRELLEHTATGNTGLSFTMDVKSKPARHKQDSHKPSKREHKRPDRSRDSSLEAPVLTRKDFVRRKDEMPSIASRHEPLDDELYRPFLGKTAAPSRGAFTTEKTFIPVIPDGRNCTEVKHDGHESGMSTPNPYSNPNIEVQPPSSPAMSMTSTSFLGDRCYVYTSLNKDEIRLLRLLPKRKELVQCELVHEDLASPSPYVALSYAWGNARETKHIELNGCRVPIATSLHGALVALRRKSEPVMLWADALCINQQDRAERAEQVQLMTRIYEGAKSVAIWLGPSADDSGKALEHLRKLSNASKAL